MQTANIPAHVKNMPIFDAANIDPTDVVRYSHYRDETPEEFTELGYGDFHRIPSYDTIEETDFYLPELFGGSDYSGDSCNVANYKTLIKIATDEGILCTEVWPVYGGHGTYAVAIRLSCTNDAILSALRSVEDYPVLDDDLMSQIEMDAQDDAWQSWAASDFRSYLSSNLTDDADTDDEYEERETLVDDATDESLRELFDVTADSIGEYWQIETGNSAYIDVQRIAKEISLEDARNYLKAE